MMFSVWNQGVGAFDYFESGGRQASLNAPKPSHIVSRTLGSTVDQAAWPLPSAAKYVGSGPTAIGRVASRGGRALGADDGSMSTVKAVLLLGAGFLAWKVLVPGGRR